MRYCSILPPQPHEPHLSLQLFLPLNCLGSGKTDGLPPKFWVCIHSFRGEDDSEVVSGVEEPWRIWVRPRGASLCDIISVFPCIEYRLSHLHKQCNKKSRLIKRGKTDSVVTAIACIKAKLKLAALRNSAAFPLLPVFWLETVMVSDRTLGWLYIGNLSAYHVSGYFWRKCIRVPF